MSQRRKACEHQLHDVDFDVLDVEDTGELLEKGPGWRKLRMTVVVRRGRGRLQRETLGWSEWAFHPDRQDMRPISFSDLDGEHWRAAVSRIGKP